MHARIIIFRGKYIGILLRNLTTKEELTDLQDKDMAMGLGLGKGLKPTCVYDTVVKFKSESSLPLAYFPFTTI